MDQELIAFLETRFNHLDERFRETSQQIEGLREETAQRFEQVDQRFEQVDTAIRHTHVSIEGLRHEVCIVAEGVMGVDERLKPAQQDALQVFEDMRALIQNTFRNLDKRTVALEDWRQRTERDPIELVRERFGRTPDKTSG